MTHAKYYYVAIIRRRPYVAAMATMEQYKGYKRIVMHVSLQSKSHKKANSEVQKQVTR